SNPGPGYLWNANPSGQWSPVAFGPLSGPLHLRRSKLISEPFDPEPHTTPFLSMSPPRTPMPSFGMAWNSESLVLGSKRRQPGRPTNRLKVYQTEPSVGG